MLEEQAHLVLWVAQAREILDYQRPVGNARNIPRVATLLLNEKPEVYIPQYVSLGPYYHSKLQKEIAAFSSAVGSSENRKMLSPADAYKVQSADRFWRNRRRNLNDIVGKIEGKLQEIEEFYNWPIISTNGEYPHQFAFMMAIDLSFLLRFLFLQSGYWVYYGDLGRLRRLDEMSVKCDIFKLENQIPLSVLSSVFREDLGDADPDYKFHKWLQMTCKELSPFEQFDIEINDNQMNEQRHLLGCVHAFVSPLLDMTVIEMDNVPERQTLFQRITFFYGLLVEETLRPFSWAERTRRRNLFQERISLRRFCLQWGIRGGGFWDKIVTLLDKIVALLDKCMSYFHLFATFSDVFFASLFLTVSKYVKCLLEVLVAAVSVKHPFNEGPRDILNSYNAGKLEKGGIKFKYFSNQPYGISFNKYTATLYLPRVTVSEILTEVLFRNMLALEFNEEDVARGDSVMRYVGLMDCLIRTPEDVRLLRESGVILGGSVTLTDEKIAGMWNGMCHPLFTEHLDPPEHLLDVLDEVLIRKYYTSNAKKEILRIGGNSVYPLMKILGSLRGLIRERLSDPGKGVAMLGGILILLMTFIQTYCALATFLKS